MAKIKNSDIIETYKALSNLIYFGKFKAAVGFSLIKNKNRLKEAVEVIEESRLSILRSLADKDEKGNPIVDNGNYVVSNKEELSELLSELFNIESEVDIIPIQLEDIAEVEIRGKDLDTLSILLEVR